MKKIFFAATAVILMAGGAIAYNANNSTSKNGACANRPDCVCVPSEECPDTPGCVCSK